MKLLISLFISIVIALLPAQAQGLLSLAGSPPSGTQTFLLQETFEAPGTIATWSSGSWASATYNTSPAPLNGSYSGSKSTTSHVIFNFGSLKTEIYGKFIVNAAVVSANETGHIMRLWDAAGTANDDVAAYINFSAGSSKQFMRLTSNHGYTAGSGTSATGATNGFPEATKIFIWWRWKVSTASDGIFNVWYSQTDNFAGKTLVGSGTTNGGRTDGVQRISFAAASNTNTWIFDDIKVSETEVQ